MSSGPQFNSANLIAYDLIHIATWYVNNIDPIIDVSTDTIYTIYYCISKL